MTTDPPTEMCLLHPTLAHGKPERRLYVFCAILVCCLFLVGSLLIAGSKLTLAIAVIPLILPLMVAYNAMLERGVWDSTVLFPAAFAAYNGLLLIRFLSRDVLDHLVYPEKFDPHDFFMAALLSAMAAIFIALAWVIWKPASLNHVPVADTDGWFAIGIVFYVVGLGLYFLQYAMIGGYLAALATDRLQRFEEMAEAQSFPYIPFVLTGLVLMMIASRGRKRQRTATLVMIGAWCLLVLAQGDRRLVLQAVLAVICADSFSLPKRNRLRLKYVVLGVASYAALIVAGQLRAVTPLLASGAMSLNQAYDAAGDILLETFKPENTEIGVPFFSVLYNAGNVKHYYWGTSYVDTIGAALPRMLYPGKKPASPAADLSHEVHRGIGPETGWGYSPVAEAYLNFGIAGVCLLSSSWMGLFILLSKLRSRSWGMVIAAVLSSECVNVNRIDFRTVYVESLYCLLTILLAAVAVDFVRSSAFKLNGARTPGWTE